MNTNNCKINGYALVVLFATAFMFTACIKDKQAEGGAPDRLFRPTVKGTLKADGNYIAATWEKVATAVSYTVQLSKDTFKTIDRTVTVDTTAVLLQNLLWDKLYQLQVRANAPDSTKSSKFGSLGAIKTPKFPSILQPFNPNSDATDEAINVKWTASGSTVTSIRVLRLDSTLVKDVVLTPIDVSNQYKIINGLAGSTSYIIELFSGTTLRGYDTYITKATLSGNIIDLRSISGRPSVLADTIPAIPSGSIVLLKRGESYTVNGSSFGKTITILSGTDLLNPNQAVINISSNFNITAGATIDSIAFKDVSLLTGDYQNKYVFNIDQSCNIGKLIFESCRSEMVRGFVRIKAGTAIIDNFIINKCVIDSVRDYGVINVDIATSKVNNIFIQKSTIYKAEKFITSKNNSNSITIENCTLNEVPRGGNYFIDYSTSGTNNIAQPIVIKNCIIGIGKDNAGNRDVRGYRAASGVSFDVSGTYATADYLSTNATGPLPNLIPYPKKSTELWKDPFNGDFTIIDNSFPKSSAGDPRW